MTKSKRAARKAKAAEEAQEVRVQTDSDLVEEGAPTEEESPEEEGGSVAVAEAPKPSPRAKRKRSKKPKKEGGEEATPEPEESPPEGDEKGEGGEESPEPEAPDDTTLTWPLEPEEGSVVTAKSHTWEESSHRYRAVRLARPGDSEVTFAAAYKMSEEASPTGRWNSIEMDTTRGNVKGSFPRYYKTLRKALKVCEWFHSQPDGREITSNLEEVLKKAKELGLDGESPIPEAGAPTESEGGGDLPAPTPAGRVQQGQVVVLEQGEFRVHSVARSQSGRVNLHVRDVKAQGQGDRQAMSYDEDFTLQVRPDRPAEVREGGGGSHRAKKEKATLSGGGGNGGTAKKGQRYDFLGKPVTSVLRWMGKDGFSVKQAKAAVEALGVGCSPTTISIQVRNGAKGEGGDPASLTPEQQNQLRKYKG